MFRLRDQQLEYCTFILMKVAQKIEKQIKKLKAGTTFKYQQLFIEISDTY